MTSTQEQGALIKGIVSIIRLHSIAPPDELFDSLVEGGIESLEVTLNTPEALGTIRRWVGRGSAMVGAGTVRTRDDASAAIAAGAQFLVTPTTVPEVLEIARNHGVPVACGALTPSEVDLAWHCGADVVKIFPISTVGGPAYLRAIREPLSDVRMLPTGGVGTETFDAYARAGAVGVGIGGSLVTEALVTDAEWILLSERARSLSAAWQEAIDG